MELDPENFRTDFVWSKKSNPVLDLLQYIHYNHDLSKTIDHESWDCKLIRHDEIKILSYQK